MANFQIKKGLSTKLHDAQGNLLITPEEGCWYITTDTFELYTCFNGKFRRVGQAEDFEARLSALEERVEKISKTYDKYMDLPKQGEEGTIYIVEDKNLSYRWDDDTQSYQALGTDYKEVTLLYGGNSVI